MRKQRAFAPLTNEEINQIADWLRHDIYEVVRQRVAQPRPEGFGLKISVKPLQLLHAKTNIVDAINSRIAYAQKLTVTELDAIQCAEVPVTEEIHDAILQATHELATSGDNTPAQLLSLQRLADFPERADIRTQRLELDLQKHALRVEMAVHRKQMDEKRFDLAKELFAFRQQQHRDLLAARRTQSNHSLHNTNHSPKSDRLGPLAKDWEGVRARARKAFNISPEESARRAHLRKTWVDPNIHLNAHLNQCSDNSVTPNSESDLPKCESENPQP